MGVKDNNESGITRASSSGHYGYDICLPALPPPTPLTLPLWLLMLPLPLTPTTLVLQLNSSPIPIPLSLGVFYFPNVLDSTNSVRSLICLCELTFSV